ncbi:MAG: XRE family transcriptional regulator [Gammaproteobacteria bacterium]|nr:XRE family transcriptional regulator [Gammaproteobacteria bacterium]
MERQQRFHSQFERRFNAFIPERLRQARMARGYSSTELADALGITRQAISRYELGLATPSGEVLGKLIEVLDFPLAFFSKPIEQKQNNAGAIFFRSLKSASRKSREELKVRSDWVQEIYSYVEQYLDFPKVNMIPDLEINNMEELSLEEIEQVSLAIRKLWGLGLGPINNIVFLLEKNGSLVTRMESGSLKTDACSQWRQDRPIVFLGSDKESAVRSRFDAAHELGHLILHMGIEQEQLSDKPTFTRIEKEANRFAGAFLLPKESFSQEVISTSLNHFISLKKRWKVSIAAMIYRCEELGLLSDNQLLYLRRQVSSYGYRKREPLDDEILPEKPILLKQAINMLMNNGVQSVFEIIEAIKLPTKEIENICGIPVGTLTPGGQVISLNIR